MTPKNPTFIKMSVQALRGKSNLSTADLKILTQAISDLAEGLGDLAAKMDRLEKRVGEK